MNPYFSIDMRAVGSRRSFRYMQFLADLNTGAPYGQQSENLFLSIGKPVALSDGPNRNRMAFFLKIYAR